MLPESDRRLLTEFLGECWHDDPIFRTYPNGRPFCGCTECGRDHCDELCRQEWYMEKRRRKNLQARAVRVLFTPLRDCPVCGNMFLPKTGNQKYCSPHCSADVLRARYREEYYNSERRWRSGGRART